MQHLVRLVDDLLDVSRITRGKIELRREVVLVNEIVSSAFESCETLFEPHGHALSVVLAPEPLRVLGRSGSAAAGLFQPSFERREIHAERGLRVGDTGAKRRTCAGESARQRHRHSAGTPAVTSSRCSRRFMSPHGNDGLGIGLALVRQLVNMHGGTVHVSSEGAGKGSEFTVSLPLLEATDPVATHSIAAGKGNGAGHGRRVLVVDDNLDAAESLASVLSMKGHVVRTATDGEQALASAEREPPDVVLMDLGMPGMDGLTAARRLRAQPGGDGIRIIALTGWGKEDDRERTRAAGIDVHLVKPVNTEVLLEISRKGRRR